MEMKKEFEKFCRDMLIPLDTTSHGDYIWTQTNDCWAAWKIAWIKGQTEGIRECNQKMKSCFDLQVPEPPPPAWRQSKEWMF